MAELVKQFNKNPSAKVVISATIRNEDTFSSFRDSCGTLPHSHPHAHVYYKLTRCLHLNSEKQSITLRENMDATNSSNFLLSSKYPHSHHTRDEGIPRIGGIK